ncbi:MAG TPA: type II toxin-antitoxin system VapC family toxin [Ktedonobacteraceae bacterium]
MKEVVVVDTSIVIKWVLSEPDTHVAETLLIDWSIKKFTILAPTLLAYEIANVLYQNVRRDNITVKRAREAFTEILNTGLILDSLQISNIGNRSIELSEQFGLPATYDAHYLALAERENCDLWTADTRLWKAVHTNLPWVHNLNEYSTS